MKTAVVFADPERVLLLVVNGDWRKYDGVWVNSGEDALEDQLTEAVYDHDTGKLKVEPIGPQGFATAIREGAPVVVCGFYL